MTMTIHGMILPFTLPLLAGMAGGVEPRAWLAQEGRTERSEPIQWTGSYARALSMARESGKPILLEFRCQP